MLPSPRPGDPDSMKAGFWGRRTWQGPAPGHSPKPGAGVMEQGLRAQMKESCGGPWTPLPTCPSSGHLVSAQ